MTSERKRDNMNEKIDKRGRGYLIFCLFNSHIHEQNSY